MTETSREDFESTERNPQAAAAGDGLENDEAAGSVRTLVSRSKGASGADRTAPSHRPGLEGIILILP